MSSIKIVYGKYEYYIVVLCSIAILQTVIWIIFHICLCCRHLAGILELYNYPQFCLIIVSIEINNIRERRLKNKHKSFFIFNHTNDLK